MAPLRASEKWKALAGALEEVSPASTADNAVERFVQDEVQRIVDSISGEMVAKIRRLMDEVKTALGGRVVPTDLSPEKRKIWLKAKQIVEAYDKKVGAPSAAGKR